VTRRPRTSLRGGAALVLVTALALAGCDRDDGPDADDVEPTAQPGDDADDVELPDVATIDPDEVEHDADPDTLDGRIASAAADLPDGWDAAVVADPVLGPYVLGLPRGSVVWRVGDDLAPLLDGVRDEAWADYWAAVLEEAGEAVDSSSLRAAVLLGGAEGPGAELHLTITATPPQDLPTEDPQAVAEFFADSFRQQRLEVEEATTEQAGGAEVAAITMVTPDDEFEDGIPRRLRQWFYPERGAPLLWSITCEGPVPASDVVDEICPTVLASFRTPPR
jgi:hypothetical protein